jgi:hypothetical protein
MSLEPAMMTMTMIPISKQGRYPHKPPPFVWFIRLKLFDSRNVTLLTTKSTKRELSE